MTAGSSGSPEAPGAPGTAVTLPDAGERSRIVEDLRTNLLVEAGAGAGKTRALTDRMVALVEVEGTPVDRIAAITFTRKAAAELRERFQDALEGRLDAARRRGEETAVDRLDRALRDVDRCVIGTIHAFCSRILREHPLEAGLDPDFREVQPADEEEARRRFWLRHLERLTRAEDDLLGRLARAGIEPRQLYPTFRRLTGEADVVLPTEPCERPSPGQLRGRLGDLLDRAYELLPADEPDAGWDPLQKRVRSLWMQGRVLGWDDDARFFRSLAMVRERSLRITQIRWSDDPAIKERVKRLRADFEEFVRDGGPAARSLERWRAWRYPDVIDFLERATAEYRDERARRGRLTFQDLLVHAARLLRDSPEARRDVADRYRHLLIDEFQDTDPLQAEVAFLVAARDPTQSSWREVVPRPGALFVVGDPKQSIYRFRRADIAVYQQVRRRFETLRERRGPDTADVLVLTANFRSRPPIESFVNAMFRDRFPEEATSAQAAFAPMRVVREADDAPAGVAWYEVTPPGSTATDAVAEADAERLAGWIHRRVEAGERDPGDFLVLTYRKDPLHHYARALEARNLPVQVTGGEMLVQRELEELVLLLRALSDPDDPTLTVAVLEGLFFGLDHEALLRHVEAGGEFDVGRSRPPSRARDDAGRAPAGDGAGSPAPGAPAVERALDRLHRWWRRSRSLPADVLVEGIVHDLGLVPFAAAGELGSTRAGTLAYVLEAVRRAGVEGDASLEVAVEGLEAALEREDAEAPLEPGREDAVRVMNLHKAKGLEAPVVVLAHPTGRPDVAPDWHVDRSETGHARGHLSVPDPDSWGEVVLARPLDWPDHAGREARFQAAEEDRLLYVAATRARDELIVSRCPATEDRSFWAPFYPELEERWPRLALEAAERPERHRLQLSADTLERRTAEVGSRRAEIRAATFESRPVTERAKAEVESDAFPPVGAGAGPDGDGRAWGRAVHLALERIGRREAAGERPDGDQVRLVCRRAAEEAAHERTDGDGGVDAERLAEAVGRVRRSELFGRLRRSETALFEHTFEHARPGGPPRVLVRGAVDLLFRDADGWVLVDYKTDTPDPAVREARRPAYRRQVELYREGWEGVGGGRVAEMVVYYVADGAREIGRPGEGWHVEG